jgi:hypothetical protein
MDLTLRNEQAEKVRGAGRFVCLRAVHHDSHLCLGRNRGEQTADTEVLSHPARETAIPHVRAIVHTAIELNTARSLDLNIAPNNRKAAL